jgi:hypothetical protein
VRAIALDRTARPAARWSAAIAIEATRSDQVAMGQVMDELIREKDPEFRASLPQRVAAVATSSEKVVALCRGPLLDDPDPKLRLAALKAAALTEPAFCARVQQMFDDPDHEVRLYAFRYVEWCLQVSPTAEAKARHEAIYRAALKNPDPEISALAAQALAKLGDAR